MSTYHIQVIGNGLIKLFESNALEIENMHWPH